MIFRIVALLALLAGSLNYSYADQIVFKNGDRVSGSVVKKDGDKITIKSDHFGVIAAPWGQVESIQTDTPLTVELPGGKSVQGTLRTEEGKLTVASTGATNAVALADLKVARNADEQKAYERLLHPPFTALWAGGGTVGFAGTAGNAKTQTLTTGFVAARVTDRDKTSVYINAIKASAESAGKTSATAQAIRAGLGYNHNVSPRLFVSSFNDYEYDKFQNLDLRFVIGGGFGFSAMKTELAKLDLVGGIDYNHESFSTNLTRSSAEAYWGDDYNRKINSATTFFQTFRMFNNLSNTGSYRINGDLGLTTKLIKGLNWNVSLSDRFLSNQAVGRKRNDLLYTTSLGFNFAR